MEFYTKSELANRWSQSLIDKYFPQCSKELPNPRYLTSSPMQLYDVAQVRCIESTDSFKEDYRKVLIHKVSALERVKRKREELMKYANGVQIEIPEIEKGKLIEEACNHYNSLNSQMEFAYGGCFRVTPSSDEALLKSVTIDYLRDHCTCYAKELERLQKKLKMKEAHNILQQRINDAIKQKYEWLQ